jgi:tetratricopeptide (TPR) repeat protein
VQRFLEQAAASLQRELRRQPFNPALAIEYSRFMGSGLPLEGHIELLARPLRYDRLSPACHDHLMSLSRAEDFDARFAPIVAKARLRLSALALPLPDEPDTWAPEILRLAAAVFFTEGRFPEAVECLELAARRYETLPSSTRISAASCYADLALCRFFLNPSDPLPAIEAARRGAEITPESEAGRAMRRGIKIKAVDYLLAAGLENEAAQSLRDTAPPGTVDEVVRRQLGIRYSRMSYDLLQRRSPDGTRMPLADFPEQFDTWLARSLELATDDHVAHLVLADLTFFRGDEAAAAVQLRQALEKGLSIEEAWRYVTLALAQQPDAPALRSLMEEIKARVAQMPPEKRPNLPALPPAAEADPTTPVSAPPETSDGEPPDTDSP